jgi:hypothetical protein
MALVPLRPLPYNEIVRRIVSPSGEEPLCPKKIAPLP